MKLREFIQETIWEISSGVTAGAVRARPFAAIEPSTIDGEPVGEQGYIEFDISLVVTDSTASTDGGGVSAGAEISVAPFAKMSVSGKGEGKSDQSSSNQQTHRVQFKVPIYFAANFRAQPSISESEREYARQAILADRPV